MRKWSDFPQDNLDRSVRRWLQEVLLKNVGAGSSEERECRGIADRLMAGIDDRSRTVLEMVGRRYDESELNRLGVWLDQVLDGAPVQHAVGWTEFRGLRILCSPKALIPRPETEEVVEWFLEGMAAGLAEGSSDEPVRVMDVGTGTGCIALAIKAARPHWEVWGVDVSEAALALARQNGRELGLDVNWLRGDMLKGTGEGGPITVHGIVSNPPYIPEAEAVDMEPHVRDREPHLALFVPDSDPLCFHRALLQHAEIRVGVGGCVVAECHPKFTRSVADCWQLEGAETEVLIDLQGAERAVRMVRH